MSSSGPRREKGKIKQARQAQRGKGIEGAWKARRDRNNVGSTRIVAQLDVRRLVRPVLSFTLGPLILVSSVCLLGPWAEWNGHRGRSWSPRFGTCHILRRAVNWLVKDKLTVASP